MPGVSFDRAAAFYDLTRGYPPGVAEQIRDALLRLLGASSATRFLELGIGTGRIALPFIRAGYHYTGVDLSLPMMDELRRKLAAEAAQAAPAADAGAVVSSGPYPPLLQADVMNLPFAAHSFDAIVIVHVLHLVDDWRLVLRETQRVLQAGGWLVASQSGWNRSEDDPPGMAEQFSRKWVEILRDLGVDRSQRPRGTWLSDDDVIAYLHELGADAELQTVAEYIDPGRTAREIVHAYQQRIFSSEWDTPDDVHTEASRRLMQWMYEACPYPDEPVGGARSFRAVIARMP